MKKNELINVKIMEAEKRMQELIASGDLKKLTEEEKYTISQFYEQKSLQRVKTAKLIFQNSQRGDQGYTDFSESVSASYYAMFYIVHAFLALNYKTKLGDGVRGVHAITLHCIVYYLVKTGKLAQHLYNEYCTTLETTSHIQNMDREEYQSAAFEYAKQYQQQRENREKFTYFVTKNAEERHALESVEIAEEFIATIRQLMIR